jgi:hypothetical protein
VTHSRLSGRLAAWVGVLAEPLHGLSRFELRNSVTFVRVGATDWRACRTTWPVKVFKALAKDERA